ncbi:hypothetical protein GOP47_0023401 [Adiantum capillus-veneris]|uniref:Protein kinase domain-containing protein n=1 Tax=Adiantum capillus-veneris TaxID=13818 RepID=A0A9D4Z5V6_ADICA|nr:hypothetical protein GOP47_0023401 [Adiantum capillus-veneris]
MGCFSASLERKPKHKQNSSLYHPQSLASEMKQGSYHPSPAPSCGASRRDFELDMPISRSSYSAFFKLTPSRTLARASPMTEQHDCFAKDPAVRRCSSYGYGDERFVVAHSSLSASFVVENEQGGVGANLFPLPLPPSASTSSSTSLNTCSDDASSHSVSSTGSGSSIPATLPSAAGGTSSTSVNSKSSEKSLGLSSTADSHPVQRWQPSPLPLPPPLQSSAVLREFSYEELAGACLNFAPEFFIREGGAGPVFRAVIKSVSEGASLGVAITRLTQGRDDSFKKWKFEVASLARLSHRHLCKVIGFSGEDPSGPPNMTSPGFARERLLVYEHSANGSLESLLYGRKGKGPLDWSTRLKIAMGAAQGLAYLHDRIPRQVIYKSFKTINIQVDLNFEAKLSDYGFARNCRQQITSSPASSLPMIDAYAAPETCSSDELYAKSNVWSFGIVLLELLTGRQNMDDFFPPEERKLLHWCRPYLLDSKRLYLIMDPELKGRYPTRKAKMVADLALQCLAEEPIARPSMRGVAATLCTLMEGNIADGKADYVSAAAAAAAQQTVVNTTKRTDSSIRASTETSPAARTNLYGSKFKLSKSHSLVSVLTSPGRVFVGGRDAIDSTEGHGRQSQRARFRGFLSGEMSKEACGSWARDHTMLSRSSYGFLSGEVGMLQGDLLKSPSSQDCYLPPPLGRSTGFYK